MRTMLSSVGFFLLLLEELLLEELEPAAEEELEDVAPAVEPETLLELEAEPEAALDDDEEVVLLTTLQDCSDCSNCLKGKGK